MKLSWYDRWVLHEELGDMIAEVDGDGDEGSGGAMRPKDWRK